MSLRCEEIDLNILILANNDVGLYNFRKELIEKLLEKKNNVYISLPEGKRITDLKKIGCKYIETKIDRRGTNIIKDIKLLLKYNNIVKKIKPDIILTYTIKPNIYGGIISRKFNIPYICNITGLGTAAENKGIIQKIVLFLYKISLKKVKCCFVQNNENLNFLKKNRIVGEKKCKLIPGSGVNLDKFKVLPYPNKNQKVKFLFISRIMKEKGIEQYIEMAKYIKQKYKETEFHILGFCEEEYKEVLYKLEEQNIVCYHGMQSDIVPFLKECSCLVHPSYYPEGMSNVLLEASASGRPVITTNRSGCKEIVEDEITGFIAEIKNSKQLIKKVERFLNMSNNQKKEMGLAARKKVEREFDRNIVVDKYLKEIGDVTNGL